MWPTHLLHPLLICALRVAVDGEEVAQALSELEIVDGLRSKVDEDKAFEDLFKEERGTCRVRLWNSLANCLSG